MIAPCFKSAQGSKKKKKEATSKPKITEKVMTKVQALPEGEKKEIVLNFIQTYDLPDMSTKVQHLLDCKSVEKMEQLIDKWTKQ